MTAKFWIGGTGTWDNTDNTHWSTTTGGSNDTTHPVAGDAVTLDAASGGGTVTVAADLVATSITMGAFTGTVDFATNDNNVTLSTFSGSGAGTRTLNMGNGTWTLTGTTGTVWDCGTVTNFTLNANLSTILLSATATNIRNFSGGGKTYNDITITNPTLNGFLVRFDSSGASFHARNLTFNKVGRLQFSALSHTITGTISTDTSSTAQMLISSAGAGSTTFALGASNNQTLSWVALCQITATGSLINATNSFDLNGNSLNGGSISAPAIAGGYVIGG